jgi:hypothetical protein
MAPAIMQLGELACDTCDQANNNAVDGGNEFENYDDSDGTDTSTDSEDFDDNEDSDND